MLCLPGKVKSSAVAFILKDGSLLLEQTVVLTCESGEGGAVLLK
jgi:hypothetical protein